MNTAMNSKAWPGSKDAYLDNVACIGQQEIRGFDVSEWNTES